ncbi:cytochrome b/b6 domain-containing protein [Pseudothioclava arenosa]|uniref:Cytochrome B n=1 Tax=Pseudothioclava arenosa TaxID=1795308 RepID=A0A2A4CLG3_9RHOB|nr:cytochrome b/b6 domain-containing protein [Pseudothioclava arenosa]PCD76833.1 cytochrome B [Pseudothioclava arenosa]
MTLQDHIGAQHAATPGRHYVWDPLVRLFHWSLVGAFAFEAVLSDPESKLHQNVGFVVLGLVLARVLWGLIGTRHARFSDFPPSPAAAIGQLEDMARGRRRIHLGHSPLGALMIYNLLATLIAIGVTGYAMTTLTFWGAEWLEELHEGLVGWAEISVVAHIAAVFVESRRLRINLPRAMVTGYKQIDPQDRV